MPPSFDLSLSALQGDVFNAVLKNLMIAKPSIVWAGRQSGKSVICERVSHAMENMHQVAIGYSLENFEHFLVDDTTFIHPIELPVEMGYEDSFKWGLITPITVVFIDDIFNLPMAEELFNQICRRTPHVVAMGHTSNLSWNIQNYLPNIIGPYSSWELNPYLSDEALRRERPRGKKNHKKFNNDLVACIETANWKEWTAR